MKILAISWKDALLRFSSRMELLFFLVLPVIFTFLLGGGAVGGGEANISILVVDEDQSTLSAQFVKILTASQAVEVRLATAEQAETGFANGDSPAWLVIPTGFDAALLAGGQAELELQKEPNNTSADAVERAVLSTASAVNRQVQTARFSLDEAERSRPFESEAERKTYYEASLAAAQAQYETQPERVLVQQVISTAPQYDQRAQASIGQMVLWVMIPLLGISVLFADERTWKTLQRLITTPTKRSTFLLGTITGQLGLAIVQMLILILFGVYVMHISWGDSVLGLAVMMVAFGLAAVSMGATLGTFTKTAKQANNLSIMLGMGMGFLGGCGWPIELFPPAMQKAAMVLPTYWAMQGFTDLAMRGEGLSAIWLEAGVLVLFAVVFFIIGIGRFRYE